MDTTISIHNVLKKYWGYDQCRPLQQEAIECILQNRDSIVVLPTGGGKSLCYQVPALLKPGLAIVISPLISLMKDQVDALNEYGINAARLDSTLHYLEEDQIFADIKQDKIKLLYLSPERLFSRGFIESLKPINLSYIAIDEAHCVSMWGHDFRPEYRQLGQLKELFPNLSLHAYTATATPQVRDDIAAQLRLINPETIVGSFDRPNLIYKIERRNHIMRQVTSVIDRHPNESGIIYCIRRKDVDSVCAELKEFGCKILPYHAGMDDASRKANQDAFLKEKVDIIAATVAFGMGIDKSNVRYVIHTGMPKSIEHYQQESGRAGRDGLQSECCLFFAGNDYNTWEYLMRPMPVEPKAIAMRKLRDMYDFCNSVSCRHQSLVRYFGQNLEQDNCSACDVCLGELDCVEDALVTGQKILSCVKRLKETFGADYTADVLIGSKNKRIAESQHTKLSTYGILSEHKKQVVRGWIEQLVSQSYIQKSGEFNILTVTEKGMKVIKGLETPQLLKPGTKQSKKRAASDLEGVDKELFEKLRILRRSIAEERDVPAFVIFGDKTLVDMARVRPIDKEHFLNVQGIGEKKADEFCAVFTNLIREFCQDHALETNKKVSLFQPDKNNATALTNEVKRLSFEYFRNGISVKEAAEKLNRAASTTYGYLTEYLNREKVTDPSPWVEESIRKRIEDVMNVSEDGRMKPIYEALNGEVSYDDIRIVMTCYKNKTSE